MDKAKLIDKLSSRLPENTRHMLDALLAAADESRTAVYLVGGPVRDLLLEHPSLDVDVVVEGDAIALARETSDALGARVVTHRHFGTATVKTPGFALDLATAREETYARPGALPTVRPASILADLARRDFTVNAMALALNGDRRGDLLDPHGGRADLQAGLVRVLHADSFKDDPTRILRAARYETRLGFRLEDQTAAWLQASLGYLDAVSGARVHHDLSRIFHEPDPERALARLEEWGALAAVHTGLSFDASRARAFPQVRRLASSAAPAAYWPLLAWDIQEAEIASVVHRLALTRPQAEAVAATPRMRWLERGLWWPAMRPSELCDALAPYPLPTAWAFAVMSQGTVQDRVLDYLLRLRHVRPALGGDALQAMGVPEGPILGEMLRRLRLAKLDGVVKSRAEEERFVLSLKPQTRTGAS